MGHEFSEGAAGQSFDWEDSSAADGIVGGHEGGRAGCSLEARPFTKEEKSDGAAPSAPLSADSDGGRDDGLASCCLGSKDGIRDGTLPGKIGDITGDFLGSWVFVGAASGVSCRGAKLGADEIGGIWTFLAGDGQATLRGV